MLVLAISQSHHDEFLLLALGPGTKAITELPKSLIKSLPEPCTVVRQHHHQHRETRDHIHIAPDTRSAQTCYQASTATSKHISHHKINQVNNALSMSGLNRRILARSKDIYMKRSKIYFIFPNATTSLLSNHHNSLNHCCFPQIPSLFSFPTSIFLKISLPQITGISSPHPPTV